MLVEVSSGREVEAVRRAVRDVAGVVEVVPAARTVLVVGGGAGVRAVLADLDPSDVDEAPAREVVLPVVYDGPDLDLVAATAGITADEVVRLHVEARYRVAFCGFAPGFAYLTGLPDVLHQARLETPRTKVPRGAVGIAGEYTAAYPRATPGGWRLIGRTDAPLFDPDGRAPALLTPGDHVRFEVV
ncbi:allophanate hydrolase subunit 1 [Saccharothrix violaceirubra]